ncbi:MAG TPA: DUF1573 domain-containing protein [Gemmataceae bacterium]|nr:DUF1573 domain-containing protein [Gemmataceae bacterium]
MRRLARWKHWAVFMVLVPTASLAAYHLGSLVAVRIKAEEEREPLGTVNGLYVEPMSLDLGEVWETPQHTFRLTIRNVGRESRTITRFQTTCGCMGLEPSGQTIAPGSKAEFAAHLNLTPRHPYQLGVAQWPVSVRVDPVFKGDFTPTPGWEVKGVVRTRVSISTAKLAFADRCAHGGTSVWQKVRAKAHVPLKSLRASVTPQSAALRVESSAASPEDYLVFVSPNPSLPIGRFHFEVHLQAVTLDDVVHPCSAIEVVGEMQPTSRVTPRLVLLGEYTIPSEAEADVTLRLPAKDWKIDHIETDTTDTLVKRAKAELEEGEHLHITQRIRKPGDHVSMIRITVRKPDNEVEIVPVEVRYYGERGSR